MVLMIEMGISLEDIHKELASRHVIDHKVKQEKMTWVKYVIFLCCSSGELQARNIGREMLFPLPICDIIELTKSLPCVKGAFECTQPDGYRFARSFCNTRAKSAIKCNDNLTKRWFCDLDRFRGHLFRTRADIYAPGYEWHYCWRLSKNRRFRSIL